MLYAVFRRSPPLHTAPFPPHRHHMLLYTIKVTRGVGGIPPPTTHQHPPQWLGECGGRHTPTLLPPILYTQRDRRIELGSQLNLSWLQTYSYRYEPRRGDDWRTISHGLMLRYKDGAKTVSKRFGFTVSDHSMACFKQAFHTAYRSAEAKMAELGLA
jgi:hypothetical protein